ncbi:MAG TPA: DUF2784 family protein, partial [Candidatus Paceibacterota bacterium]
WSFLVFGGAIYMLFHHEYAIYQVVIMTLTVLVNIPLSDRCPLTLLEEKVRQKVDPAYTNNNSFLTTYLNKILSTNFKTHSVNSGIMIFYTITYATAAWFLKFG